MFKINAASLLCICFATASTSLADEAPEKPAQLIEQTATTIERLSSLAMTVNFQKREKTREGFAVSAGGGNRDLKLSVLMADGGRFSVRARENDKPIAIVACDGKTITELDVRAQRWTRYPLNWCGKYRIGKSLLVRDNAVGTYTESWVDADGPYRSMLYDALSDWDGKNVSQQRIDGAPCVVFHLERKMENGPATLMLDGDFAIGRETRLPRRLKMTMTMSMPPIGTVSTITETYDFADLKPDAPVSPTAFVVDIPDGASFVDPKTLLPKESPLIGKMAPDVTLRMADGSELALDDFQGKRAVLLVFWATWCMPCKQELAMLPKLRDEFPESKLAIIAVNGDRSEKTTLRFLKKHPIAVPVALDPDGKAKAKFPSGGGFPSTILIDKSGDVREVFEGWGGTNSLDETRNALRRIFEAKKSP